MDRTSNYGQSTFSSSFSPSAIGGSITTAVSDVVQSVGSTLQKVKETVVPVMAPIAYGSASIIPGVGPALLAGNQTYQRQQLESQLQVTSEAKKKIDDLLKTFGGREYRYACYHDLSVAMEQMNDDDLVRFLNLGCILSGTEPFPPSLKRYKCRKMGSLALYPFAFWSNENNSPDLSDHIVAVYDLRAVKYCEIKGYSLPKILDGRKMEIDQIASALLMKELLYYTSDQSAKQQKQ